jgi:hypothetical protein
MDNTEEVSLEMLRVKDELVNYGLVMRERGFAYPPNFTGSTDGTGLWIGPTPYEVIRIRLDDGKGGPCAYIFPKTRTLIRCDAENNVVSTEEIPETVTVRKRPPPLHSVPRARFNGIKDT